MNIIRSIRKRFVQNQATESDIAQYFKEIFKRSPTNEELIIWKRKYLSKVILKQRLNHKARNALTALPLHEHSRFVPALSATLISLSNEKFVEFVYLEISGRYPSPSELQTTSEQLRSGALDKTTLILMHAAAVADESLTTEMRKKSIRRNTKNLTFTIMGTPLQMSSHEWQELRRGSKKATKQKTHARFPLQKSHNYVDVSVICSLWRGAEFIERYMENITNQSIFNERCELIIVDAASPEGEAKVVEKYRERFSDRIRYFRIPYRASIYVAWNFAVESARGRLLTNANLDDLRSSNSLELQCSALDALPHVDVVYSDHLYFTNSDANFEEISRIGVASELPLVTRNNLFSLNPPHNAPMWRAELHKRIGLFDERYKSAGDYDFWIRAAIGGAQFYKLNEPSVAYYVNPKGLSTSADGLGVEEARLSLSRHGSLLIPEALRENQNAFLKRVGLHHWPEGAQSRYAVVQRKMRELVNENRKFGSEK